MPPIKLGMIGAGIYATEVHLPSILAIPDQIQVNTVYSRTLENAQKLADKFPYPVTATASVDSILNNPDIDAVDILLPIHLQATVVEKALKAGKHILSEKPIAHDLASSRHLLEIYAACENQVWMVGEQWRYEEAFLKAREIIDQGVLGELVLVQWATFSALRPNNKYYHTAWRRSGAFRGGVILDGGIHRICAFRMVIGEISQVSAFTTQKREDIPPIDTISANFVFENGCLGSWSATYGANEWLVQPMTINGTEATLRVERGMLELVRGGETEKTEVDGFHGVQREIPDFAKAIREGSPIAATPEEAYKDLAVMMALMDSGETGKIIDILV